jgi:methionine-rich copper-binding protein CopC
MGAVPLLALALLWFTPAARGHAIALSSKPAENETVAGPDVPVKLRFNSRIDGKRSRLILLTPGGGQQPLVIEEAGAGDTLASVAKGLKPGAYTLRWQVLASDGHITRGEVPFQVK